MDLSSKAGVNTEPDFIQPPTFTDSGIPQIIFYVIYTVLFLIGIIGNSLLAFIIGKHKRMRTVPNMYILNLTVANLVEIFSSILSWVSSDRVWCGMWQASRGAAVCMAVYTLLALSSERYHAIAFPLRRDTDMAGTAAVIVAVWTLSILFGTGDQLFVEHVQCTESPSHYSDKSPLFEFLFTFLIPLIMIVFCYLLMAREIYLTSRNFSEKDKRSIQLKRLLDIKKKITWVVVGLVLVYVLSFLPYYVVRLLLTFRALKREDWETCAIILYPITFLHCCLNPVILYVLSESCRKQFKHYFFYWLHKAANPLSEEDPSCAEDNTVEDTLCKEKRLLETPI